MTNAGKRKRYGMSYKKFKKKYNKSSDTNRKKVLNKYEKELDTNKKYTENSKKATKLHSDLYKYEKKFYDKHPNGMWTKDEEEKVLNNKNYINKLNKLDEYSKNAEKEAYKIGKKYFNEFSNATLKDIQYNKRNIDIGKEMVNDYLNDKRFGNLYSPIYENEIRNVRINNQHKRKYNYSWNGRW